MNSLFRFYNFVKLRMCSSFDFFVFFCKKKKYVRVPSNTAFHHMQKSFSHSLVLQESINKLDLLVERPIEAINDTHYRVCWAAINAIEVFSKNLNPEFQFQYYEKVLPALTKALNFSSHPSIQVYDLPHP